MELHNATLFILCNNWHDNNQTRLLLLTFFRYLHCSNSLFVSTQLKMHFLSIINIRRHCVPESNFANDQKKLDNNKGLRTREGSKKFPVNSSVYRDIRLLGYILQPGNYSAKLEHVLQRWTYFTMWNEYILQSGACSMFYNVETILQHGTISIWSVASDVIQDHKYFLRFCM